MKDCDDEDINAFTENPKRKFTDAEIEDNMERKAINAMDSLSYDKTESENTSKRRKFVVEPNERNIVKDQIQHVQKNMPKSKRSRDDSEETDCGYSNNNNKMHNNTTYESTNETRGKRKRLEQVYNNI